MELTAQDFKFLHACIDLMTRTEGIKVAPACLSVKAKIENLEKAMKEEKKSD